MGSRPQNFLLREATERADITSTSLDGVFAFLNSVYAQQITNIMIDSKFSFSWHNLIVYASLRTANESNIGLRSPGQLK